MEFVAATKNGLLVMDATSQCEASDDADYMSGLTTDGQQVKIIATLPSPDNAFGHAWSSDGKLLGSVSDEGVKVYDAERGYKEMLEVPKVAPDVGGRSGGVRNLHFSPLNNFVVTYEKWDPQYPENCHVFDLRSGNNKKKLYSCVLHGYTSGALTKQILKWTYNESSCVELKPGEGLHIRNSDLSLDDVSGIVAEKNCANFELAPKEQNGDFNVACYMPDTQGGMTARVAVYNLSDPKKMIVEVNMPAKVKDVTMLFNPEGTELLALASSDVDETGSSYFGTTYLYWISLAGKKPKVEQICGAKEGIVQDLCWSPTKNEFTVIYGMLPATVALFCGTTGKKVSTLGTVRRNTLRWCPFGRFLAVGGFGTLPGDLDFFDRSCEETVSSLRAALTVECSWAPDGRHFITSTIAPRMNEGNQITVFRYTGEQLFKIEYKPSVVAARHEDTGAGARTKTQAILFSASWRPRAGAYEDKPATPRGGPKRKKGLPEGDAVGGNTTSSAGGAYRPKGAVGGGGASLIQAMMRGEIDTPQVTREKDEFGGWKTAEQKPLEEWEIRKIEKERKKEAERKEQEAKEQEKQALRNVEQSQKDGKKKLKLLKAQLEELDALKEKDWDELTEEDEAQLELETEIRAQIAELEKSQ